MTEPADPDLLVAPPDRATADPVDVELTAGRVTSEATSEAGAVAALADEDVADPDRRHAARVALALLLLAPFLVLGGFAVLVDRADEATTAVAAPAAGATSAAPTTVLGTGVTNMTPVAPWQTQFLACVRQTESGGNYAAVNPSGAGGAYQIMPTTWNNTAQHIGRPDLVGVAPQYATPSDQDLVAAGLLEWQGPGEWQDGCG